MRTPSIPPDPEPVQPPVQRLPRQPQLGGRLRKRAVVALQCVLDCRAVRLVGRCHAAGRTRCWLQAEVGGQHLVPGRQQRRALHRVAQLAHVRSEEHTSELQSLMRSSYAVFWLKTKKTRTNT